MVATDTVVGIVGAVVLVAVMAGVFVYEYNNTPESGGSPDEMQAHFEEDYAGLAATQDLDGDGKANFEDNDIDGDGINNTEDDMLTITVPVSGSVPQRTPQGGNPFTQAFTVGNGSEHLKGTLTYQRTAGAIAVPSLTARIVDSGGQVVATASSPTPTGTTVTLVFDHMETLEPGTYTLEVSHAQAGPAASVAGSLEIHYATPAMGTQHEHA